MKLTKTHKQAFVSAVMNDVPQHDFSADYETLIKADMLATAHPKVKAVLEDKETSHILFAYNSVAPACLQVGNSYFYPRTVGISSVAAYHSYKPSDAAKAASGELMRLAIEQHLAREKLRADVTSVIGSCTTLKQAHERLPEFTKYLPEELEKSTMLPAIANLAADLMKAGWPKGVAA